MDKACELINKIQDFDKNIHQSLQKCMSNQIGSCKILF